MIKITYADIGVYNITELDLRVNVKLNHGESGRGLERQCGETF